MKNVPLYFIRHPQTIFFYFHTDLNHGGHTIMANGTLCTTKVADLTNCRNANCNCKCRLTFWLTTNQILLPNISFSPHTGLIYRAINIPKVAKPTHASTIKIAEWRKIIEVRYFRAVFKWLSKVITWLRLLRLVIGLKDSRQFFNQWEVKPEPIAPWMYAWFFPRFERVTGNC